MVDTVGMKLRRARTLRQLSLDDAARATKIRVARLSDLEADVYTNFPNIAYAKGFLTSYGRYLGVDVRPYLEAFADTNTFGLDDYQYLSEKPIGMYRAPRQPQRQQQRQRRGGRMMAMVATVSAVAALAMGAFGWMMMMKVQRLGDLNKLAAHQQARENPGGVKAGALPAGATLAEPENRAGANGRPGSEPAPGELAFSYTPNELPKPEAPAPVRTPVLPVPGDGAVLREMTLGTSQPIFLARALYRFNAAPAREERLNAAPASRLGSRFYVHALGGAPVDASLEDDAQQPPVRVNNSLE